MKTTTERKVPPLNLWPIIDEGLNLYAHENNWDNSDDYENTAYYLQLGHDDLEILLEYFVWAQIHRREKSFETSLSDEDFKFCLERLFKLMGMHRNLMTEFKFMQYAKTISKQ